MGVPAGKEQNPEESIKAAVKYIAATDRSFNPAKARRKIRHTTKIRHNTTKIPAKAEILEDYYRVHAPKLQNIYDDKPVGALKRKPQRLPVRDTPHDDSGFEIDRLDMQVVKHIQPRPPGIFV